MLRATSDIQQKPNRLIHGIWTPIMSITTTNPASLTSEPLVFFVVPGQLHFLEFARFSGDN
jgi:hypothetical protein